MLGFFPFAFTPVCSWVHELKMQPDNNLILGELTKLG